MNTELHKGTSAGIEMDAHEFGLHLKQGGWRLGLLVARDVEPFPHGGNMSEARSNLAEGKVNATWFADHAGTTHERVMRYYRAWERYAAKGRVPHAAELSPGDEPEIDWERLPRWTLSELPDTGGATGPLNLTISLGRYGQRLLYAHKRLISFIEKDLAEGDKPGETTRELAGRYAEALELQAKTLRQIEAGEVPSSADELEPSNFFVTA